MTRGRDGGFTLLELLLALTMLAVMVAIVFGTFRVGVRAWEKGERDIEARHKQRIVLEQVRRQMASMSTRQLLNKGQDPFFPEGAERRLRFISEVPLLPGNDFGLVLVEYRVEEGGEGGLALRIFERNLVFLKESDLEGEPDGKDFVELLPGLAGAAFAYHDRPGDGQDGTWREEWVAASEKEFPRAVRLTLTPAGAFPETTIIAGIDWEEGR